jgi:hypothetical protein
MQQLLQLTTFKIQTFIFLLAGVPLLKRENNFALSSHSSKSSNFFFQQKELRFLFALLKGPSLTFSILQSSRYITVWGGGNLGNIHNNT